MVHLFLVDHANYLDPRKGSSCRFELLGSQALLNSPLYEAMVLFNDVVQVLALPYLDVGIRSLIIRTNGRPIGTTFVDVDQFGYSIVLNSLDQEGLGTHVLSAFDQQKVYRVPVLINSTIQALPLPFHFVIGLVHPPPLPNRSLPPSHLIFDSCYELEHPGLNGGMVYLDTTQMLSF